MKRRIKGMPKEMLPGKLGERRGKLMKINVHKMSFFYLLLPPKEAPKAYSTPSISDEKTHKLAHSRLGSNVKQRPGEVRNAKHSIIKFSQFNLWEKRLLSDDRFI